MLSHARRAGERGKGITEIACIIRSKKYLAINFILEFRLKKFKNNRGAVLW